MREGVKLGSGEVEISRVSRIRQRLREHGREGASTSGFPPHRQSLPAHPDISVRTGDNLWYGVAHRPRATLALAVRALKVSFLRSWCSLSCGHGAGQLWIRGGWTGSIDSNCARRQGCGLVGAGLHHCGEVWEVRWARSWWSRLHGPTGGRRCTCGVGDGSGFPSRDTPMIRGLACLAAVWAGMPGRSAP